MDSEKSKLCTRLEDVPTQYNTYMRHFPWRHFSWSRAYCLCSESYIYCITRICLNIVRFKNVKVNLGSYCFSVSIIYMKSTVVYKNIIWAWMVVNEWYRYWSSLFKKVPKIHSFAYIFQVFFLTKPVRSVTYALQSRNPFFNLPPAKPNAKHAVKVCESTSEVRGG